MSAITDLYAKAGYGAAINPSDMVIVAHSDEQLVGVVRLCTEEGVAVLRGMQVRSAFQRQGIGAQLLRACKPFLDQHISFCLPYAHLLGFYGQAGFETANEADLPDVLAQRLSSYTAQGKDILAMRRFPHGVAEQSTHHSLRTLA
ncbi:GNAT family N-acetyltransferase [Duganella aquatilis]|nr:GNAT family N-acetyltransferase [Duganella aquatilis]